MINMESLSRLLLSNNTRRIVHVSRSYFSNQSNASTKSVIGNVSLRVPGSIFISSNLPYSLHKRKCSTFMQSVRGCSSESDNIQNTWTDLSFEDLCSLINGGNIQLFDVREPKELKEYGAIPNSVNIPLGQLYDALRMPGEKFKSHFGVELPNPDDDNIVFTCLGGVRSHKALLLSKDIGYVKARHYKGGWEEWSSRTDQPLKKT